ncbi:MAG: hypothetical protein L0K86_14515 [Actinomycetia bacterium]|nr:hypothetical protein [Actinomycetes bacterium]
MTTAPPSPLIAGPGTTALPALAPATTTGTMPPAPAPASDSSFDTGDWLALGVGIVSVVAAVIAFLAYRAAAKSAREAERSADAAVRSANATEDAVEEQRKANALALERDCREQEERAAARGEAERAHRERRAAVEQDALDQARRVTVQYFANAGVDVVILNGQRRQITDVLLVDVKLTDHPTWTWKRNPTIFGGPGIRSARLLPGKEHGIPVVFYDEGGGRQNSIGACPGSLVRFTDDDGTRWEVGAGDIRKVPADDSDLPPSGRG